MPRDGTTGAYSLPSGNPVTTNTTISSTVHNATNADLAAALTASVAKDGQTTMTGNLPMGGNKLTNISDSTARNQYPSTGQLQDGSLTTLGSVAGTDTITGSLNPPITSYATRMMVTFTPANNNTGAATIAINGLAAKSIVKGNAAALVAGDLVTTVPAAIIYDGTNFVLLNPQAALPAASGAALTNLNASNLASGTVPDARFPATLPAASGANLTSLNAANLASGSIPDARVQQSNVTQHQAALTTRNITGKTGTAKTLSSSSPSGGSDGDIWYQYV